MVPILAKGIWVSLKIKDFLGSLKHHHMGSKLVFELMQ